MEVSQVRRRVQAGMASARERAKRRREHAATAESAYESFLTHIGVPLARQIAGSLKAEGYAFTVSTPGRGLRLALDRGQDDFVELTLDADVLEFLVSAREPWLDR